MDPLLKERKLLTSPQILGLCLAFILLLAQQLLSGSLPFHRFTASPSPRGQALAPEQGFTTRAFSGIEASAPEWAAANGVTPSLSFSHNLSRIFAPALYDEHPEFFPLVGGKRFRPGDGPAYWNPDLGRADVAAFAAEAARAYFAEHPEKLSFSVGVNDALLFGESEETLRAIARHGRRSQMGDGRWGPENRTSNKPAVNSSARSANSELRSSISGESSAGAFAWFRERPDYSNLVFAFTNRVAEQVAATHPEKYIGALAYYWAENAPDFPLHPNVVPFLTADRSQGYDRLFKEEEALLQRRWAARSRARLSDGGRKLSVEGAELSGGAGKLSTRGAGTAGGGHPNNQPPITNNPGSPPPRLGLYDYLYGKGFLIPRLHTRLLAENLRQAHRIGFTDYYAEMSPNWGLDGPQPWLVAQLLQDPEQSPEVLLDAYYRSNFGLAAVPMRRFFERCERQWMTQPGASYWLKHYRNESQASLFPSGVCRDLRALLTEAERVAGGQAGEAVKRLSGEAVQTGDAVERLSGEAVQTGEAVDGKTVDGDVVRKHEDGRTEGVAPKRSEGVTGAGALGQRREQTVDGDAVGRAGEAVDGKAVDGGATRANIKLVSDAFGVTERFVAMQEARDQVNRLSFAAAPKWRDLVTGVRRFVRARDELTDYTNQLREMSPLAVAAFQWEDYLRHDPVANALIRLRAAAQAEGQMDQANATIASAGSPELSEAWALCAEADRVRGISLVRNGGFAGDVRPARRIAGLDYGVALPEGWESSVEPVEFQRAELRAETGDGRWKLGVGDKPNIVDGKTDGARQGKGRRSDPNSELRTPNSGSSVAASRVLRLTGNKETSVYQWATPKAERVHVASVQVRGHVSPGTVVSLTFGFLDGEQQRLELQTLRLPEGDWPQWVTLRLIDRSPPGAKWVGIGVRVQNQVAGDWAEVKEFELSAH